MKFQQYQKIELVEAAKIEIPEAVKAAVRKKQPQTVLDQKVRYSKENGVEEFSILFPQNSTEVTLKEGDYVVKTKQGLVGMTAAEFNDQYGLLEATAKPAPEPKKK